MYCTEFFHKYQKDGNFCGLDKSQVSRLNKYLDIAKMLEKQGISEEDIYKKFPLKAAEPLIAARDQARTDGMNYVTSVLKRGLRITQKDMQTTLRVNAQNVSESCINATITEPKKQDPAKCFSPQPGTIEVTDAPPIAPLAAVLKERYSFPEIPPQLSPDADMGERLKRDAVLLAAFTTADKYDPLTGGKLIKSQPYVIKPVPVSKEQFNNAFRGYFTPKTLLAADELIGSDQTGDDYAGLVEFLVFDALDKMGAT